MYDLRMVKTGNPKGTVDQSHTLSIVLYPFGTGAARKSIHRRLIKSRRQKFIRPTPSSIARLLDLERPIQCSYRGHIPLQSIVQSIAG